MAAPTGSLYSTESVRIEEIINRSVGMFLPSLDPFWENTIVSNQDVAPSGQFGRDWLVLKTFMGSLAGVLQQGAPDRDWALYGDPSNTALGSKVFLQGLSRTFPSALDGSNPAPYRLGIPLRSMVANIMVTLGELQMDAHDALIGQVVVPKMTAFGRHIALQLCNYFYLSQNSFYALSSLGGGSGTGWDKTADSNLTLMVDTTYSNYAVDRFQVGMRVQIYDATGVTIRQTASLGAATVFVVTAVDELHGKVYFKAVDGLAVNGGSFADTDIIVFANSKGDSNSPYAASPYFTGIAGINSWLKVADSSGSTYSAGNTLLGAERDTGNPINVNVHPEFASMTYSMGGDVITEHILRKILRRFHAAKNKYGQSIDTLVASDGVWLAYEAQKIGRQYYERSGKLSNLSREGSEGNSITDSGMMGFHFDGRTYRGYTSTFIESNTAYGLKTGDNNWKRYVPPDISGAKKFDRAPSWSPFRFVGSALTGTNSNQIPIFSVANNRTLVTEGVQMPGYLRMQLAPDQPAMLKITSIAEDRVYAG